MSDQELAAMRTIVDALAELDEDARQRALAWATDRYYPRRWVMPELRAEALHRYTAHGHSCCDLAAGPRPSAVAKCGGPAMCGKCGAEVALIHGSAVPA